MPGKNIRPELSALGIRKSPNPILPRVFSKIKKLDIKKNLLVVDHGCGQLRNVNSLLELSRRLILVDTEVQITKKHKFFDKHLNIKEYVKQKYNNANIKVLDDIAFRNSKVGADFIFSINVFDVILPKTRSIILSSIKRNLSTDGTLILIVPRNDTWTLRRCTNDNKYADGYVFHNHGAFTFYKNWNRQSITNLLKRHRYKVVHDISTYKYLCLFCTIQLSNS